MRRVPPRVKETCRLVVIEVDKLNLTKKKHHLLKHVHMPASDRAKIYLPFDALPGLREALAEVQEEFAEYGQEEKDEQ